MFAPCMWYHHKSITLRKIDVWNIHYNCEFVGYCVGSAGSQFNWWSSVDASLRGTGSLKDAIKKVDCGWKKVFVKIFTQGGFPQATRNQYINSFVPPPFSPPIPPTFNFSIIYSSEIPHIPPPLAIRDNLMRATSSLEILLSFNGFEQIEKAHNKGPN